MLSGSYPLLYLGTRFSPTAFVSFFAYVRYLVIWNKAYEVP